MMPFVLKRPNGLAMRVAALVLGVAVGAIASCSGFPETIDPALVFGPGDINELLDLHTDSHVDAGCSVEIIADNDRAFEAACELIRTAQDHINLETLYFGDDEGGDRDIAREFIALLAERVAAGVAVNVVVDAVAQGLFSKPELLDELEAAGVCLRRYAPPADKVLLDQVLYRTHKKILIADGRRALAGGRNMGFHYFGHGQWRDTSVLLTGPAVATLQREFARDWEALGGEVGDEARWFPALAATGQVNLRLIDHRPAKDDFDLNTAVLIAVRSATTRIDIATPNLNPPGWLADISADQPLGLVTLGSTFTGDLTFFSRGAEAIARAGMIPLVVIGYNPLAPDQKEMLKRHLPGGTRLLNWVDYDHVFPRLKAIVHHGGMGTTHAAIVHGIPQVIAPHAADQRGQARRARQAKVGLEMSEADVRQGQLNPAVQAVTTTPLVLTAAERLAEAFAGLGGPARAADLLAALAEGQLGGPA